MTHGSVVLAWISPGQESSYFVESLVALHRHPEHAKVLHPKYLHRRSGANVARARNLQALQFLNDTDGEWLMMLDADISFPEDTVARLLWFADPKRAPVMSGIYYKVDESPRANGFPHVEMPFMTLEEDGGLTNLVGYPPSAVMQVAGVPAGCLLVHRGALEAVRALATSGASDSFFMRDAHKDWPFFAESITPDGTWFSEDFTFCMRLMAAGIPVHVATSVVVGHHKDFLATEVSFATQGGHIGSVKTGTVPREEWRAA